MRLVTWSHGHMVTWCVVARSQRRRAAEPETRRCRPAPETGSRSESTSESRMSGRPGETGRCSGSSGPVTTTDTEGGRTPSPRSSRRRPRPGRLPCRSGSAAAARWVPPTASRRGQGDVRDGCETGGRPYSRRRTQPWVLIWRGGRSLLVLDGLSSAPCSNS